MSKKTMLLALAAVSAAMFALPAAASAQEAHIEGVTSFSGTFGASSLTASGEPVITCEGPNHVTGTVNAGGTTGNITLDFTACHTTVLGATIKCRTSGSPIDNTIASSGVFHVITTNNKPGVLVTPAPTAIICGGLSTVNVAGNIIGTITSPACGVSSTKLVTKFTSSGAVQEDKSYTGTNYNLTAQTGSGEKKEAGLTAEATLESATAGKVNCT
jgi:hypothetical protein